MKFTFTEKRMASSEDLRAYSMKKIGKLDKLFKNEADAYVTFSIERGRFLAEITIRDNGMFYRASELTNDMYASVDSGVVKFTGVSVTFSSFPGNLFQSSINKTSF